MSSNSAQTTDIVHDCMVVALCLSAKPYTCVYDFAFAFDCNTQRVRRLLEIIEDCPDVFGQLQMTKGSVLNKNMNVNKYRPNAIYYRLKGFTSRIETYDLKMRGGNWRPEHKPRRAKPTTCKHCSETLNQFERCPLGCI